MLEGELGRTDLVSKYVDVLSKLIDGVYRMLDIKVEMTELVVDDAGYSFNLQYVRIIVAHVQQAQVGHFIILYRFKAVGSHLEKEGELQRKTNQNKLREEKKQKQN